MRIRSTLSISAALLFLAVTASAILLLRVPAYKHHFSPELSPFAGTVTFGSGIRVRVRKLTDFERNWNKIKTFLGLRKRMVVTPPVIISEADERVYGETVILTREEANRQELSVEESIDGH